MNCQDFEQLVVELAAAESVSVRNAGAKSSISGKQRLAALTHAAVCEACAGRAAAEKKLNEGLATLAADTGGQQAPARVKQSLRAAFEARQATLATENAAPNVIRMPARQPLSKRPWVWVSAAAAAIVLAFAIWRPLTSNRQVLVAGESPTPTVTPNSLAPKTSEPQTDTIPKLANWERTVRPATMPKRLSRPQRQQTATENQLAANYIPLSYAKASAMPEESLVVRVEVSRATLIAMGLPLNAERGNEMVKADLRVGLDGVPLAIRLARQ